MRRRAAERRRLVGLVRGREPWVGHNTIGPLRGRTRWSPNLADRGRRPNLESGAGLGPRFQGEPVAPPTLSTVGPAGAYVIGSTSTPFVRASQCTCGPVDTPLEPTDAIRSPPTTRSHRSGRAACRRGDTCIGKGGRKIGRAHVGTPVLVRARMPASGCEK